MDFFKIGSDVDSLDELGVLYEEPQEQPRVVRSRSEESADRDAPPQRESSMALTDELLPMTLLPTASASGAAALADGTHTRQQLQLPYVSADVHGEPPGVAADFNTPHASSAHRQPSPGDNSLGFTFSGQPTDVVRFRSCIPPNMPRNRSGAEAASPPEQSGPFQADILNVILLFVDVSSMSDILEVSRVCRFTRYYAGFAPHWTCFRRQGWSQREDRLAQYLRAIVAKPKVMTREEYFTEKRRVEKCEWRDRILDRVKHVRWCVAMAIMAAAMMTANYVVAYFLGFLRTALRSDAKLGATTAVQMVVMTLMEVVIVMIPLGGVSSPSHKDGMLRILAWGLVMLCNGIVLGTITALAFTRVQANGHVLDAPTMNFTMAAECTVYPTKATPSFTLLPTQLSDLRWRPITTDPAEKTLLPYCIRKTPDDRDEKEQCYVLLYFDAKYESGVFRNATMLRRAKNVGTTTALGFDPFEDGRPIQGTWCAASPYPQLVAVSETTYAEVATSRNELFPSDRQWLTPSLWPRDHGAISYRCSSDINREATEDPRGASDMWYENGAPWRQHYIPLMSTQRQPRQKFQEAHDHFLRYAFRCYIISACIWVVELLAQCIVKGAAIDVLGVTATAALVFLNPVSLLISGSMCVFVENRNLMCDEGTGYGLIGSGIALLLVMTTVLVVVYD